MRNKSSVMLALLLCAFLWDCGEKSHAVRERESKKVISVNTFEDRSIGTGQYKAFKNGIPSQIIEAFIPIPYLTVINREEVIRAVIKNKEIQMLGLIDEGNADRDSVIEMGKMLNAQYVITGFFMVLQNKLQISAAVMNIETSEVVHQTSVNGLLNNFFTLQKELAVRLVEGIHIRLNPDLKERIIQKQDTRNLNAFINNYDGEKKMEIIEIIKGIDKEKELARMGRLKDEDARKSMEEIRRRNEIAEQDRKKRDQELAKLREQERVKRDQKLAGELKTIQERRKLLEARKLEEERGHREAVARMEALARAGDEKWKRELDTLRNMNLGKDRIARERENAESLFRKAIEFDAQYTRARRNLAKLIQAVPMTL